MKRKRAGGKHRLFGLGLGGALLVAPAAFAAEPTTPAQADQMAQAAEQQAARYRELGGPAYKGGLVQQAENEATRYTSLADQMEITGEASAGAAGPAAQRGKVESAQPYKSGLAEPGTAYEAEQPATAAAGEVVAKPPARPDCDAEKPGAVPPGCPK